MRNVMVLVAAALLPAGCGTPAATTAEGAWVRLPAVPGRPAAAYFTLHAGAADATLIAVATPAAARAELHESMAGGMRPLAAVPVAAGTAIRFAPAGRHVMLFDVSPRVRPGKPVVLHFSFADGRQVDASATVVGAADPAPGG